MKGSCQLLRSLYALLSQGALDRRGGGLRHCRSRRGAALMEFLLAFPVYAVLLGGLFLLGEMLLTKVRLQRAERFLLWSTEAFGSAEQGENVRKTAAVKILGTGEDGYGKVLAADPKSMDVYVDKGNYDEKGFYRRSRGVTEMTGGMRDVELVALPGTVKAFLQMQEKTLPPPKEGETRASQGGFVFERALEEVEGEAPRAVSVTLLRLNNNALRSIYYGEPYPWIHANGKILYLLSGSAMTIASDVWPYLEAEMGDSPMSVATEEQYSTPEQVEQDKGGQAYERSNALAPFAE